MSRVRGYCSSTECATLSPKRSIRHHPYSRAPSSAPSSLRTSPRRDINAVKLQRALIQSLRHQNSPSTLTMAEANKELQSRIVSVNQQLSAAGISLTQHEVLECISGQLNFDQSSRASLGFSHHISATFDHHPPTPSPSPPPPAPHISSPPLPRAPMMFEILALLQLVGPHVHDELRLRGLMSLGVSLKSLVDRFIPDVGDAEIREEITILVQHSSHSSLALRGLNSIGINLPQFVQFLPPAEDLNLIPPDSCIVQPLEVCVVDPTFCSSDLWDRASDRAQSRIKAVANDDAVKPNPRTNLPYLMFYKISSSSRVLAVGKESNRYVLDIDEVHKQQDEYLNQTLPCLQTMFNTYNSKLQSHSKLDFFQYIQMKQMSEINRKVGVEMLNLGDLE